jgi:cytochrome c556
MYRKLIVAFAVLLLGVTTAAAQSWPEFIKKRQTLMKKSGAEAKIGTQMIKGERPFDAAKVQEIYASFANDAKQMPTLFPDCSKTGAKTTAAPAIWERMDDFKAAIAKFADDIKAAQDNTKDLDALKANFQTIGKNCSNCHQTFRIKTSWRGEEEELRGGTCGSERREPAGGSRTWRKEWGTLICTKGCRHHQGDKAKTQTYCQKQLGPEYLALIDAARDTDPNGV